MTTADIVLKFYTVIWIVNVLSSLDEHVKAATHWLLRARRSGAFSSRIAFTNKTLAVTN